LARKLKIKKLAVADEGSLPGLQMASFLCIFHGQKEESSPLVSSYKGTNPLYKGPTSQSNYLPKICHHIGDWGFNIRGGGIFRP
jgi:hypothetical protein